MQDPSNFLRSESIVSASASRRNPFSKATYSRGSTAPFTDVRIMNEEILLLRLTSVLAYHSKSFHLNPSQHPATTPFNFTMFTKQHQPGLDALPKPTHTAWRPCHSLPNEDGFRLPGTKIWRRIKLSSCQVC